MKKIASILLVVALLIAGGAFLWLSGGIDSLLRDAITRHGSAMSGATVEVGSVSIAPTDGKGTITDLKVGNPAGFKTPHALKVGRIEVEIDLASVAGDVVLVRRIAVHKPDVIYEKGDAMTNFDAIQRNIAEYLGPTSNSQDGKKLVVEELTIRDATAHASAAFMNGKTVGVPLPDITLRNLGKAKGGITPGELGREVTAALKNRLTASVSFDRLLKSTGETLDQAGARVKNLFK